MKKVVAISRGVSRPIHGLSTVSPLPSSEIEQVDPFIFLNHHGPQVFQANNTGLPFGPHPHRGIETVTFVIDGELLHQDTTGYTSNIKTGGIQWMLAGSGLIHAELSTESFKKNGGNLEILQLWLNLPKRLKMHAPQYIGKQNEEIPQYKLTEKSFVQVVSGKYNGVEGSINSVQNVFMSVVHLAKKDTFEIDVPLKDSIFCYVVRGSIVVDEHPVSAFNLVVFDETEGEQVSIQATDNALILFGYAKPHKEPMVAYGPFVMNTEEEIEQAYKDYQSGKFGVWKH
jgi:redox-sensitive bicupin YhaK (pirin superfamily)